MAEQFRQIEQSRIDALEPLGDGLAAHAVPVSDTLERHSTPSLGDRREDVTGAVDLAGQHIGRQHAFSSPACTAPRERHREALVVRLIHLQTTRDQGLHPPQ